MKIGHAIEKNGFWVGDVIEGSGIVPDVTTTCPDGFYKPRWDGQKWAEGETPEEREARENQPLPTNPDVELAAAIQAATTLPELKAALLGNGGNARVKGKMK